MENWKDELQKYLPGVEEFLTSVLLEETKIDIVSTDSVEKDTALQNLKKKDAFLFTRDEEHQTDFIIVLDEEWYGLLSSIMLGIEEKSHNEITRDLLKKFSNELSVTVKKQLELQGMKVDPSEIQVLTHSQAEKILGHGEYFRAKLEVEGLADDKVRAEFLLGNAEAQLVKEEPKEEPEPAEKKPAEKGKKKEKTEAKEASASEPGKFKSVDAEEMEKMGQEQEIISAKHIEFDDFEDLAEEYQNGDSHSMDMLKDVEMDVSVELGRIELPLGKVLQLAKGSVIELEKLAGEPVNILVNGHCIAHGEVVVIDEHFGVRVSNLVTTHHRIAGLK